MSSLKSIKTCSTFSGCVYIQKVTVQPVQWNVKNVINTSDRTADSGIFVNE